MLESFIVLSFAGLITGILFSIPAAGPVTILIVSNALKGKQRYCHRVAYGAAVADLIYTFIAVYAFAQLYRYYNPYVPYIEAVAAVFLVFIGIRMFRTRIDFEHMDDKNLLKDKIRNTGGFRTGMMVNLLNPALFIGWLISSFLVITLISSMGFNTGGLSEQINETLQNIDDQTISNQIEQKRQALENLMENMKNHADSVYEGPVKRSSANGHLFFFSFVFALMVTIGSTVWFYMLANFMISRRKIFRISTINKIVNILGIGLIVIAVYLAFDAVNLFFIN